MKNSAILTTFIFVLFLSSASLPRPAHAERIRVPFVTGVDLRMLTDAKPASITHAFSSAKKATVLVFMSAKCPCSQSHEADLIALAKEYESKGFRFLAVHSNADESVQSAQAHFKNFTVPVLQDDQARLADLFGALKTPHAFVVRPNGEIAYSGGVDDCRTGGNPKERYLKTALEQVDQARPVEPSEVRTMGCRIARP